MYFSLPWRWAFLLPIAQAQFNLPLAISELPACSLSCAQQLLPVAGCEFQDIPSCLCTNTTLQLQLASCVLASCNQTEQFAATSVTQNLLCKGVPQPSRSREIIRTVIIITAITFPILCLRLFSRYHTSWLWWDDWLMIAGIIIMVPMTTIPIYNATRGFGKHAWDVPVENLASLQELYYVSQILYALATAIAKGSMLLLFLRIFPGERFRFFTKIALVWMALHAFALSLAVTFQCIPVSAVWNMSIKGRCVNSTGLVASAAALSLFEDIVIILFPIGELKRLRNLSIRKRLAVIFMFALGSFACITSMIRLKYIVDYHIQSLDTSWTSIDVVLWSIIEVYTAMICSSLMCIRPLLTRYMPSIFQGTLLSSRSQPTHPSSDLNLRPTRVDNLRVDSRYLGPPWGQIESEVELKDSASHRSQTSGDISQTKRGMLTEDRSLDYEEGRAASRGPI